MNATIKEIQQRFRIVGNDPAIQQALNTALQVAPTQLSVLVLGESGTGKDVFPQVIHAYSKRKHGQYIPVNCGAIPEGTLDSELFGHEKGSFTGATNERKGYFEEANGGTIFLDEIGEMPLATQAKLLRVLESGEYMRVGSSVVRRTDVRIIAATNVNLERAVKNKKFREDLYFRLSGVIIRVPPLRSRREDIPQLFRLFSDEFAKESNVPVLKMSESADACLMSYDWPGNVRQLKYTAQRITVLCPTRDIDAEILEEYMPKERPFFPTVVQADEESDEHSYSDEREMLFKVLFDMRSEIVELKRMMHEMRRDDDISSDPYDLDDFYAKSAFAHYERESSRRKGWSSTFIPTDYEDAYEEYRKGMPNRSKYGTKADDAKVYDDIPVRDNEKLIVEDFSLVSNERQLIVKALKATDGRRREAAKLLGISERTLFRKINDYDIDIEE